MKSIRHIFQIGYGPSSSHTMGPRRAAEIFLKRIADASRYEVILYGSLAATGKGHLTHKVICEAFHGRKMDLIWKPEIFLPFHPNGIQFKAFDDQGNVIQDMTAYSVGGSELVIEGMSSPEPEVYSVQNMNQILYWCSEKGGQIWEFVESQEEDDITEYLNQIWQTMKQAIHRGLENEGRLPGDLNLPRKAASYFVKANNHTDLAQKLGLLFSFALAVAEENASGGLIVTAPTCGSCGVLPGVLYVMQRTYDIPDKKIIHALETAGMVGNLVKSNASISGAEVGCQGEIGTACAMAAAAITQLLGGSPSQIEYAAEMGMEHHLGLTCDPILGLVQIPCIERNAFAAERAYAAATYAMLSDGVHRVSFDQVVQTMMQTGIDLSSKYRETAKGGLAVFSKR